MDEHELARWDLPYRYGSRLFIPTASFACGGAGGDEGG